MEKAGNVPPVAQPPAEAQPVQGLVQAGGDIDAATEGDIGVAPAPGVTLAGGVGLDNAGGVQGID